MNPQQPLVPPAQPPQDPPKPVAYDQYGQPLYAHPPTVQPVEPQPTQVPAQPQGTPQQPTIPGEPEPQVVYMTRSIDPHQQEISADVQAKHAESERRYPYLNLSEGEFVISAVRRHPIGLVSIWGVVVIAVLVVFIGFPILLSSSSFFAGRELPAGAIMSGGIMLLLAAVLFVLGGIIATVVYQANRFYLTNESVIQHIQTSLFTKKDQTISLQNIEDASYRQQGIIQTLLNYGAIRLSTEGEETTYRFNFVANPKKEIDRLNNAVEAFKNFRPVETDD
jgi:hypothetical protein